MRSASVALWVFTAVLLGPGSGNAASITLDSQTDISIFIDGDPGEHGPSLEKLLERYLLRALQKQSLQGDGEKVEFVIRAEAPTWDKLPRESVRDVSDIDSYVITISAKPKPRVLISGKTALGAGFGIMHFLEHDIGITWLFPGELGVALPKSSWIVLRETTDRAAPLYISRIFSGMLYRDPALKESYLGTFFGSYDYFKCLKLHSLSYASHALVHVFDVKEFGATQPDIYPLKDGKRYIPPVQGDPNDTVGLWSAWHPCYSNPKTTEIAIRKAKEWFEKGSHTFSLGINDGYRVQCQCDDCKKAGWPNAYFNFVTKVAGAVKDYYPPHMVGVLAYGDVKIPPADLKLPGNVVVLVTGAETRLETWAPHASHVGIYEYFYGDGWWIPNFPLDGIRQNESLYRDLNARFYYAEAYPTWAFDAPKVAIRNRLMWDAKLDVNDALDRWCRAAFGDGGQSMARYYRRWAALQSGSVKPVKFTPTNRFEMWRNPAAQFASVSRADFDTADACFAKAKRAARAGPERARVEMVEAFHESSKNLFQIYSTTRRAFDASAKTDWTRLATELSELNARRLAHYENLKRHPEWFDGTANTLEAAWAEKNLGTLPFELDAALDGCRFHGGGQRQTVTPEVLHPRWPHPWYPAERYDALAVTTNATVIVFRSVSDQSKPQVSAHYVNDLAAHGGRFYKCDLSLTGQDGEATIQFHMGSNNSACPVVQLNEKFGRKREERKREVIVRPRFFDSKTRRPDPDYPSEKSYQMVMEVVVTWKPSAPRSELEGTLSAERIEHQPNAETAGRDAASAAK